ncbi:hypothetical protein FB451DRAFT_1233264 [Mycena latifolia]|nr:hypothetical protein FB451DRAFT_1233264 [Mycena latifolia]
MLGCHCHTQEFPDFEGSRWTLFKSRLESRERRLARGCPTLADSEELAGQCEYKADVLPRLSTMYVSPKFRATPIDVVCEIFKYAATDRGTAVSLLRVSKAIHDLLLPVVYDTIYLKEPGSRDFAYRSTNLLPVEGCQRPSVRHLNTVKAALGPWWRHIAHGRPEIEHVCLSMMDLHAMASLDKQLQPLHVGIVVDGIQHFPEYVDPPPCSLPRSTRRTSFAAGSDEYPYPYPHTRPRALHTHSHVPSRPRLLRMPRVEPAGDAPLPPPPHATFFTWATHIYFTDNMPPHLGALRPYLQRLTHFAFAYRRDYGLQFPALAAVLRAVLGIPSVQLVLIVRNARAPCSVDERDLLWDQVPESRDPRVVFFVDLGGLTWEADEPAIWRLAEERRLAAAPFP